MRRSPMRGTALSPRMRRIDPVIGRSEVFMVMDRNGRRHKASGLPGAGRYERDMEAADDLDLDLYEPDGPWESAGIVAEGIDDGWIGVTDGVGILSDDALDPTAPRGVEAVVAAVGRRDYRDAVDRLAAVRG